jgi:predicted transcriptional regulator
MAYKLEKRRTVPRKLSNPLRCEHVYRILVTLEEPVTLIQLIRKAKISPGIYYTTIEKNLLQLGLIRYEERGRSTLVILTDKGRKLLEVLKELGFSKVSGAHVRK